MTEKQRQDTTDPHSTLERLFREETDYYVLADLRAVQENNVGGGFERC